MSWGLPEAPGRFQGPRDAQGVRESECSKLGARGASWGLSEVLERFQRLRDAHGTRGSKGVSGASWEQGE